jgi:hypothetical protein
MLIPEALQTLVTGVKTIPDEEQRIKSSKALIAVIRDIERHGTERENWQKLVEKLRS